MDIKNKSLREAYALLENTTPLGRNDCGSVCDAYCCSDALGDSMELFPYEKEIFETLEGFEVIDGEIPTVKCNGTCEREARPLACRIYPLFPLVVNEDGEERIRVIYDPRATASCPLCAHKAKLDRRFVRAVRRAGKYLLCDEQTASHLRKTSEYLTELIELEVKLGL
jgi:hypothetical protein